MLISKNPYNGIINASIPELADDKIEEKLSQAQQAFESWRESSFSDRDALLNNLGNILIENKKELASIITSEIGQPIKDAISEIEKCALTARYYEGNISKFLKYEKIKTENSKSMVVFEPLGVILGIVPWNFPFWMAFRFIIPTIAAGNTVVLKHASNVPLSALKIEEIVKKAGFPDGVMQTLLISSKKVEQVITNPIIKGVSFAGSKEAGSIVASTAAKHIKKTILELGGSDPFIVFSDADINTCSNVLVNNRLRNAGQACNSPKRVFVHQSIFEVYLNFIIEKFKNLKIGDPMLPETEIGPIATESGINQIQQQVDTSINMGAKLIMGGRRSKDFEGLFYEPTILTNVNPGMPVFDEEVFGPVIAITTFDNNENLIDLINKSNYGLGASIWTKNIKMAKSLIPKIEAGNVFINKPVRSDPRLPYGGIKKSGYGRELGSYGIKEFVNIKTIVIH